ncbi:unnamed protein product [Somion occarium]|uniref:Uncharacterized protein n=1 Tax=Somion occarium TaxID=3059160 RepID=A0ABP1DYA3_9APHY
MQEDRKSMPVRSLPTVIWVRSTNSPQDPSSSDMLSIRLRDEASNETTSYKRSHHRHTAAMSTILVTMNDLGPGGAPNPSKRESLPREHTSGQR